MKSSQDTPLLYQMLQTLEEEEFKEFLLFAQSPHWKGDKKRLALLDLLKKSKGDWGFRSLLKPQLRKLFPASASSSNVDRLLSETTDILREFLIYKELDKQKTSRQLLLSEALLGRKLKEEFKKSLRALEDSFEGRFDRSASWFLDCYRLEDFRRKNFALMQGRLEHNFGEVSAHFNAFILLEKLKYACFLLLYRNVLKTEVPPDLMEELEFLAKLHRPAIEEHPALKIFNGMYLLYKHGNEQELTANELREMMEKHKAILPEEELEELYGLLFSFLIFKINTMPLSLQELNQALDDTVFCARYLDAHDLLQEGSFIPHQRFKNVITAALTTGKPDDLEWAKKFFTDNWKKVGQEFEQDIKVFCQTAIHFYEGKLPRVRENLKNIRISKIFYRLDLKSIALRLYLEEGDNEDFFNTLSQARHALATEKNLSPQHENGYSFYFDTLEQLFDLCHPGPPDRLKLIKMKSEIEITAPLPQRKWLLEKVLMLLGN